jgi:hypothetical protein
LASEEYTIVGERDKKQKEKESFTFLLFSSNHAKTIKPMPMFRMN